MQRKELPGICQEGQHAWVEMTFHNDYPSIVVLYTPVKSTNPTTTDLTCSRCFQQSGKPQGVRNEHAVYAHEVNTSLEQAPSLTTPSEK